MDRGLVDEVIHDLRELHRKMGLAYHLAMGRLVLQRFFLGNGLEFDRTGRRHASYRDLATRPDLPVSASTLYTAVAVTRQFETLPQPLASKLRVGHHRALLPLKCDKARASLAERALGQSWTVRRLQEEVARLHTRKPGRKRRGRPPLPGFMKTLNRIERLAEDPAALQGLACANEMAPADVEALVRRLRSIRETLDAIEGGLLGTLQDR